MSLLVLFTLFATSEESPHERQVRLAREAADAFALWRTRHGDQVEYLTAQFAASHSSWRVLDELSPFLLAFFLVAALGLLTLACLYWLARPKVPPKRA